MENNYYWTSFKTFFKIGAFTLGGGYAMIPIIQSEVVDKQKWIDEKEPGTETKVTPDMQEPIIANATTAQCVLRPPV